GRDPGSLRQDGAFVELGEDESAALAELAQRPATVGIFSFNHLALQGGGFLSVPLDGVAPTLATIANGAYRPARPVYLYVKRSHAEMVPGLRDYLATVLGPEANGPSGYLTARGLVPLPPAAAETQRAAARSLPTL